MRIKVSKYNSEGYYSPTEYEGMMNILREEYEKEQERKRKKAFMPKVFICSPFRGEVYKNIVNAKKYCRFAVDSGYIPFAPHLFFPRFLVRAKNAVFFGAFRICTQSVVALPATGKKRQQTDKRQKYNG